MCLSASVVQQKGLCTEGIIDVYESKKNSEI